MNAPKSFFYPKWKDISTVKETKEEARQEWHVEEEAGGDFTGASDEVGYTNDR